MASPGTAGSAVPGGDGAVEALPHAACDLCDGQEGATSAATLRCIECGLLCEACGAAHARMTRVFGAHTVRPRSPLGAEPGAPSGLDADARAGEAAADVAVARVSAIHCDALAAVGGVQRDLLACAPAAGRPTHADEQHLPAQKGTLLSARAGAKNVPGNIWEWRLRAAQQDARQQEMRAARRMHRKFLPRMVSEYSNILEADGPVANFERALKDSLFTTPGEPAQRQGGGGGARRPASAFLPPDRLEPLGALSVAVPSGTRAASAMPALQRDTEPGGGSDERACSSKQSAHSSVASSQGSTCLRLEDRIEYKGPRATEPGKDAEMRRTAEGGAGLTVQPKFLDMPSMGYAPGATQQAVNASESASAMRQAAKQAKADGIVQALRPPAERDEEAYRLQYAADHAPSEREIYDAYYKHLKTLNAQVTDKLLKLESLFAHESQDAEALRLHAARDMGLDLGSRARGTLEHAEARKALKEAGERWSAIQGRSMEVDHSLLTMTSEWERTEEIMNKTDELLKSFDAMADQHMLVHSAAFDPAQFEEAGGGSVISAAGGGSIVSSVGGQAQVAEPTAWKKQDFGDQAGSKTLNKNTNGVAPSPLSQWGGPPSGSLMNPNGSNSLLASAALKPSGGRRKARPPAVSRAEMFASWMQAHNIQAQSKVFNAEHIDRAFMSSNDDSSHMIDGDPSHHTEGRTEQEQRENGANGELREDQEDGHFVEGRRGENLLWHLRGDITQKVKQARGVVHSHDASTQIPELDEGSMTLGSRLGNVPKIVSDFAVRGLEFPAVWIPFVAGIPQHLQEITVIEPEKVNTMLLDLYFHKVLIDHENSGVDNLYHMSFSEFVILHMVETKIEDLDVAKASLRDFLYSVVEHRMQSDRFLLFLRFCGIPVADQMGRKMEPLSELMLEYYLGFLMECRDFVLTVASKDGSLPEMVSKGREFLLFDDVEHICKRVCRSTMAAARQVSFFGNTLTRIRVYKGVHDRSKQMDVVDVEHVWHGLLTEYEKQFDEARKEAEKILTAADVDGNGQLDLQEFIEVVSVFDDSFTRAQTAKMWIELVTLSGSERITCDAFLNVGDKFRLFSFQKNAVASRDMSVLRAHSWRRLSDSHRREDELFAKRLNMYANKSDECEAHSKELQALWQSLKREAEDIEVRILPKKVDAADIPCPGEAWKKYELIYGTLSGQVVNYGVRRIMNTLKIIGAMKPVLPPPSTSDTRGLEQDKGGGEGALARRATSKGLAGGEGVKAGGKERQTPKFVKDVKDGSQASKKELLASKKELQASKKSLLSKLDKAEEGGGSSKERKSEGRSVGAASVVVGETDGGVEKSKGKKKKGAK